MGEKLTRGVFYVEKEEEKTEERYIENDSVDEYVTGMDFRVLSDVIINMESGEIKHLKEEESEFESGQNKEDVKETGDKDTNSTGRTLQEAAQKEKRFGTPSIPSQYKLPGIVDTGLKPGETICKSAHNVQVSKKNISSLNEKHKYQTLMPVCNQLIHTGFENVSKEIVRVQDMANSGFDRLEKKITWMGRKEKRAEIGTEIISMSDGSIYAVTNYDDGSQDMERFIWNIYGPLEVASVVIEELPEKYDYFVICFNHGMQYLWVDRKKITKEKLFEVFLQMGIIFSKDIPAKKIKDLLYTYFLPRFTHCTKSLEISQRTGWKNKLFLTSDNFPFRDIPSFRMEPVMCKKFGSKRAISEEWKLYFSELCGILNEAIRLVVMLYPFSAMLASIMYNEGFTLKVNVNLIKLCGISLENICLWMQIFNKKNPVTVDAAESKKNIVNRMANTKDEVLLLNCLSLQEANSYYTKTKLARREYAANLFEENVSVLGIHHLPFTFGLEANSSWIKTRSSSFKREFCYRI